MVPACAAGLPIPMHFINDALTIYGLKLKLNAKVIEI